MLAELEEELLSRRRDGVTTALVIDEAQCLERDLLEEIRMLSNIETPSEKLLPLVLVGQPEFAEQTELAVARAAQAARRAPMHARHAQRGGNGGLRRGPGSDRRRRRPRHVHARRPRGGPPPVGGRPAHHQRHLRQRAGERVRARHQAGQCRHGPRGLRRLRLAQTFGVVGAGSLAGPLSAHSTPAAMALPQSAASPASQRRARRPQQPLHQPEPAADSGDVTATPLFGSFRKKRRFSFF